MMEETIDAKEAQYQKPFFVSQAQNGDEPFWADYPIPLDEVADEVARVALRWHKGDEQEREAIERVRHLGGYVWELRLQKGLSLRTLAQRAGLGEVFCFKLERGIVTEEDVSAVLDPLAQALDCPRQELRRVFGLTDNHVEADQLAMTVTDRLRRFKEVLLNDEAGLDED